MSGGAQSDPSRLTSTENSRQTVDDSVCTIEEAPSLAGKAKCLLFGKARDLNDASIFHHISLIPILAWIGLGSDGLSSSAYGPEEAFKALGGHQFLALGLIALTTITIATIAAAYSRIIEEFPHGGGGYVVAGKLLGEKTGLVSGAALLVDYILTITVSIAAAGDALFSLFPPEWAQAKIFVECFFIVMLMVLNIRGVKESVLVLAPIFFVFLLTHIALIGGAVAFHVPQIEHIAGDVGADFQASLSQLGGFGLFMLIMHAYSLGGGTYTGLEAVSNGLPILREPRVQTAKKTMLYMAVSLAFTAGGLFLCYLVYEVGHIEGKTLNAVVLEAFAGDSLWGRSFVYITLLSEGALLVAAAQAGFLDGPRVLSNMAVDNWVPRSFSALSERLTTHNGVMLM